MKLSPPLQRALISAQPPMNSTIDKVIKGTEYGERLEDRGNSKILLIGALQGQEHCLKTNEGRAGGGSQPSGEEL